MLDFVDVGEFDNYLTLQEETVTRDTDLNAIQRSYSTYANVWAKRIYKKAGESIESNQDNEVITRGYLVQFEDDIDRINARHRLVDEDGSIFYIDGVDGGKREGYFIITATRRIST